MPIHIRFARALRATLRTTRMLLGAVTLGLGLASVPGALQAQEGDAAYKVVVNEKNAVGAMSRDELSRLFLKKSTSWSNGQTVALVDRAETSPVRAQFTADVHKRQVRAVKRYWQQMIFGGRAVPPPEKASDEEVLAFVRANPNAIGYVAATTPVGSGVKTVAVAR